MEIWQHYCPTTLKRRFMMSRPPRGLWTKQYYWGKKLFLNSSCPLADKSHSDFSFLIRINDKKKT